MTTSHGLTQHQLRELEAELLTERRRLERSLKAESDGSTATGGFTSRAAPGDGLAMALETRTHARYGAILDALTRLASGTYGTCVSCSNGIPYGRLIVMPEVAQCLACGARG